MFTNTPIFEEDEFGILGKPGFLSTPTTETASSDNNNIVLESKR